MISIAKSIAGSSQAINYVLDDKGKAIELDRNGLIGTNGEDILQELRMVQAENTNCQKNTISIVLSPDAKQGNFSQEELKQFLHKHLDNLGLKDNQWIATVHSSTENKHIHIIANRINLKGEALNDSFISKKAQESAERIAKEYGFVTAQERSLERAERIKEMKKEINHLLIECKSKSKSFEEFNFHLKSKGFELKPSCNSKGAMFGMRIEGQGESFKLSEINRNIKHYHFADLFPKGTLIQASDLTKEIKPKASGNIIADTFSNQIKGALGKEVQGVFKAVDIVSSLSLEKLAINAVKSIVKGIERGGMSM